MKLFSANSKGTGKLGGSVYAINHGVQIKREYQGKVSNPNTTQQVSQRSRFKLASQVSAAMAPVIAFPRKGLQSPRNLFVKRNMPYFYGDEGGAQVSYENLQLVPGNMSLPSIQVDRTSGTSTTIALAGDASKVCDRVIYCVFLKGSDNALLLQASVVVSEAGESGSFPARIQHIYGDIIVYAYGMRDNSAKARAKYGNYFVENATDVARLISSRALELSDYTFTQTRGVSLAYDVNENDTPTTGEVMVYLTVVNGGVVDITSLPEPVAVTGNYSFVVDLGSTVSMHASHPQNFNFLGWYRNGEQTPFSMDERIVLTANGLIDVIARYDNHGGLE